MNSQKLIIFNDCSAFVDVTESAEELFSSGALDLYEIIISEQYESLIDSYESLQRIIENGGIIGIEAGFLNLNIGIHNTYSDDKLLITLGDYGIQSERYVNNDWDISGEGLNLSLSQNNVFDDENNLIQNTGISHNDQRAHAIDSNLKQDYTRDEILKITTNMKRFGGGFISALSEAINKADSENLKKLQNAFPEEFEKYLNF